MEKQSLKTTIESSFKKCNEEIKKISKKDFIKIIGGLGLMSALAIYVSNKDTPKDFNHTKIDITSPYYKVENIPYKTGDRAEDDGYMNKITINKNSNARVIPCPGPNIGEATKKANENNLKIIAVVGAGRVVSPDDKLLKKLKSAKKTYSDSPFMAYHEEYGEYHIPAGVVFNRFNNSDTAITDFKKNIILREKYTDTDLDFDHFYFKSSGYITYFDGSTKILDFSGQTKKDTHKEIESLKKNSKVQGFSVTGINSRNFKLEELSSEVREDVNVFVFDKDTELLYSILTVPETKLKHINDIIEHKSGTLFNFKAVIQKGYGFYDLSEPLPKNESKRRKIIDILLDSPAAHCLVVENTPKKLVFDESWESVRTFEQDFSIDGTDSEPATATLELFRKQDDYVVRMVGIRLLLKSNGQTYIHGMNIDSFKGQTGRVIEKSFEVSVDIDGQKVTLKVEPFKVAKLIK
jgi:hypothetical protein